MLPRPLRTTPFPYTTLFRSVPRGSLVETWEEAQEAIANLGYPVVIKPLDGNHGKGVAINLRDDATSKHALEVALGYSRDRKSTRLNSSHSQISYAVFCLKKK